MAKVARVQVKIPVSIFREDDVFVAYTPVLDLSTSGKNHAQVKERFVEAVGVFFEELLQKGTLDEVLADLGWKKIKRSWSPPTPIAQEKVEIQVPVSA